MKFSKSILAVSLTLSIQGAHAEVSLINESRTFDGSDEIQISASSSEGAKVYTGIEANNGNYSIKTPQGSNLLIRGDQSSLPDNATALFGISAQKDSSLSLEGDIYFDLNAKSAQIRAIRANGNVSIDSSTSLTLGTDSGLIIGIDVWDGSTVDINGKEFVLEERSNTGRITGIQNWDSSGGVVNFNSDTTRIHTDNSGSTALNQAVLSYQSTTNFNGNTDIEVVGGQQEAYGVDVQCDPGLQYDTVVNFNGLVTNVAVQGKGYSAAIRPSGATGFVNIKSNSVDLSASSSDGPAIGVNVQYGASLAVTNKSSKVNISASSSNGQAFAIYNSTYGGTDTFQFGSTEIEAQQVNLKAEGRDAFGLASAVFPGDSVDVLNDKDGVSIKAETIIETISNGGNSIGIYNTNTNNGNLTPKSRVTLTNVAVSSTSKEGGNAYAVYLTDNGILELGSANLTAESDGGEAVGIYNANGSIIKFGGNSIVKATVALVGNGTVNVERGATLTLDGKLTKADWAGVVNVNGKVAYGVPESVASSDLDGANDGTLLVLAGTEIAGNVNVGTVIAPRTFALRKVVMRKESAPSNSLKIAKDGMVLVRAADSYDGKSALIKVDSVKTEKGSAVHLLNSVAVPEGTKVFESNSPDEESLEDYVFTTDNHLKKVVGNRVVGEKSTNLFGLDFLIPNVVDAAANATNNEGAKRILSLTDKALTKEKARSAIHQIALMATASGAQSTAINVANLQLDVIDTHASKLASHAEDKVGADLWIDMNGFLSKTNDYSAGSTKFGYKSDLAGVTIGSDCSFGNGYAAGVSVAFGKGSVRGQGEGSGVKNDVDYYGVNLFGVWSNDYFNTIGSVGYLQTKNEIKTQGFKGKPDAKTVSVGVRFEKPLALNEAITVTPHLGVRYKHVKLNSFNAGGFKYTTEKADIVEVPFGVAFNANLKAPCGADVKPFVDLTIAPNFGDRKVSNKIALAGTTASDSFDARIANDAMYNAKVGVNAVKGSHTFGLNYGIGGGNRGRVDQTLQARYTYRF